jgi:hypothetical protein
METIWSLKFTYGVAMERPSTAGQIAAIDETYQKNGTTLTRMHLFARRWRSKNYLTIVLIATNPGKY